MMQRIIRKITKPSDMNHPRVKFIVFQCNYCGKEFEKMESYYKKQLKKHSNACVYCSKSCRSSESAARLLQKGEKHPKWKGGNPISNKGTGKGYKLVYQPEKERNTGWKYAYEHRLIVEQFLKRKLRPDEHVHHIDGNSSNNDISNLEVLSKSEHPKLHGKERGRRPGFNFAGRKHSEETKKKISKSLILKYRNRK